MQFIVKISKGPCCITTLSLCSANYAFVLAVAALHPHVQLLCPCRRLRVRMHPRAAQVPEGGATADQRSARPRQERRHGVWPRITACFYDVYHTSLFRLNE